MAADGTPMAPPDGRRVGVAVLGSTGSIGRQTLEVLAGLPDFRVVALAAGTNARLLAEQARQFRPRLVGLSDPARRRELEVPAGTTVEVGTQALAALVSDPEVEIVVVGTGGLVALEAVLAALHAGRIVATANKETLVAGGHLVIPLARQLAKGGGEATPLGALRWLRPIDSEHSALWQCLVGEGGGAIARLILTGSGGPFLRSTARELTAVGPADALRHPTWRMGAKITVDSATLVNKGLEVIEAHWLYDVPYDQIDVVIHPQSIVHSAVVFADGAVKAQLALPDMRLPIQYALTYPARRPSPTAAVDLVAVGRLEFSAPDLDRFPALRIAREAGRRGSRASAALVAADEVAVASFLAGRLPFTAIPALLERAVAAFGESGDPWPTLAELQALDDEVRAAVASWAAS